MSIDIIKLIIAVSIIALCNAFRTYIRLRYIPGPWLYAVTRFRLAKDGWEGNAVRSMRDLHRKYGPVVRVGPNQISFNSLSAQSVIYGASFDRTDYYKMFDVCGRPNLVSLPSNEAHRQRKKLLSHTYTLRAIPIEMIRQKVADFMMMVEPSNEIFRSLHYFLFDMTNAFVLGEHGATKTMTCSKDRGLLDDIRNPNRQVTAWFTQHFPSLSGWMKSLGFLRFLEPFTYTGIQNHALEAFYRFKNDPHENESIIARLFQYKLDDMDIISECADHLLAGIETTSTALVFLIWNLSLPQHANYQERLREEISNISVSENGIPDDLQELSRLPLLNAVLKEGLRLYPPSATFKPRSSSTDVVIDNYLIPAGTVVGMSQYCMHREETVFPKTSTFRPERWLDDDHVDQDKWFWAFSSGPRMCIGKHLANAEMLTLIAAIYYKYTTVARYPWISPAVVSRYEIFYDENTKQTELNECWIDFC